MKMIPEGVGPYTTNIPLHYQERIIPGAKALYGSGQGISHLSQKIEVCALSGICIWVNEFWNEAPVDAHYMATKDWIGLHYLPYGNVVADLPPFSKLRLDASHYSLYRLVPNQPHFFTLHSKYTLSVFISFKRSELEKKMAKHAGLQSMLRQLDTDQGSVHLDMALLSAITFEELNQKLIYARNKDIWDQSTYFKTMAFKLLNCYPEDIKEAKRSQQRKLENERAFANLDKDIKEHFKEDLPVAALAKKHFKCASTMETVCKEKTKMTVSELITATRLDSVEKDLLKDKPINVDKLASDNGFVTRRRLGYAWELKRTLSYREFQAAGLMEQEEARKKNTDPDNDTIINNIDKKYNISTKYREYFRK